MLCERNNAPLFTILNSSDSRTEKKKRLKEIIAAEYPRSLYPYAEFVEDLLGMANSLRLNSQTRYPKINKRASKLEAHLKEAIQMFASESEYKQQLRAQEQYEQKQKEKRLEQERIDREEERLEQQKKEKKKKERERVDREKEQLKEFKKLNEEIRDLRQEVRQLRRGQRY